MSRHTNNYQSTCQRGIHSQAWQKRIQAHFFLFFSLLFLDSSFSQCLLSLFLLLLLRVECLDALQRSKMGENQNILRKRREYPGEYPPTGPEHQISSEIASTLLMLNVLTLRSLQKHEKSTTYRKFRKITKGNLANINHDDSSELIILKLRVTDYVRTLTVKALDEINSNAVDSKYYREAILLQIDACERAREEEEWRSKTQDESPWGDEALACGELHDMVNISQSLYMHVKDAAVNGYLDERIGLLKDKLQSIDVNIRGACEYLRIDYQPLVYPDDADQM